MDVIQDKNVVSYLERIAIAQELIAETVEKQNWNLGTISQSLKTIAKNGEK